MYKVTCISGKTPSRGWYSIFPFVLSEKVDYEQLRWSLKEEEELVLARINLCEFKDSDIDDAALDNLSAMFDFFRQYDKEIILRFVYDVDGNGLMNEPESIKIIKRHIEQTAPYIINNRDIILTMQGVFIGSWGEMHTSRYADSQNIADLVITLYKAVKGSVRIALRKPSQIRELIQFLDMILYEEKEKLIRNIGLYDDAMMSSDTDMGTFSYDNIDDDMAMVKELSCINVIGGEVVADNALNDTEEAIDGLKKRCVTYLNSQYDAAVLDKWREQQLHDGSSTIYQYVTEHLGYRLEYNGIRTHLFSKKAVIYIKNTGFAPFYGKIRLAVNGKLEAVSESDIIKPGESAELVYEKSQLPKELTLLCIRISDGKSIGLHSGIEAS